jgi:hypothetical protein
MTIKEPISQSVDEVEVSARCPFSVSGVFGIYWNQQQLSKCLKESAMQSKFFAFNATYTSRCWSNRR